VSYAALRHVHLATVVVAIALLVLRGVWVALDSPSLRARWVRILPHVNDTLLIASAGALAWRIGQYPLVDGWLTAKVLGLLAYIALGVIAMRSGRGRGVRIAAWLGGLAALAYTAAVAVTRQPLPFVA
jgi:uncharacterized membrane protein SirB2